MNDKSEVILHVCEVSKILPQWGAAPPSVWQIPSLATVVDTGLADPSLVDKILAIGPVDKILVTHDHPDHTGNLERLLARTGAALFGPKTVCDSFPAARLLSESDLPGIVLPTPGHTADHLSYLLDDGTFFAGDFVLGEGTPWVGPPEGDLPTYLDTLERFEDDHRLGRLCGGHGPVQPDARAVIRATLAHRLMREQMIREVRDTGLDDEREIAERVYNGIEKMGISGLQFEMAVWTVRGHLQRLKADVR